MQVTQQERKQAGKDVSKQADKEVNMIRSIANKRQWLWSMTNVFVLRFL